MAAPFGRCRTQQTCMLSITAQCRCWQPIVLVCMVSNAVLHLQIMCCFMLDQHPRNVKIVTAHAAQAVILECGPSAVSGGPLT